MSGKVSSLARNPFVSGLIGGLVVLAFGVVALAAGWISDDSKTTVVQTPIAATEAKQPSGLTVRNIYDKDAQGVVFIQSDVVQNSQSPFGLPQQQRGEATGSGFVLDKDGYVLTNAHVVDGASKIRVRFKDDKTVDAKLIGKDTSSDIALLKVNVGKNELHPLELGDSSGLHVGDPVVAIGNPFGLDRTATTGIVSALQRQIKAPNNFTIDNVIQTDAAINPGNSGGPLIDAAGKVVGVNSQIATAGSQGNIGIGFAIPIKTANKIADQLRKQGKVEHAYLGIVGAGITPRLADALNLSVSKGVVVQQVTGPAKKAGLKGGDTPVTIGGNDVVLGGDVITKVDGKDVGSMKDVIGIVDAKKPGDTVKLTFLRSGKQKVITVKLGTRPQTIDTQPQSGQGGGGETVPPIPGIP